jgi:hypothetical protein
VIALEIHRDLVKSQVIVRAGDDLADHFGLAGTYAGIQYQVFGVKPGALALTTPWTRLVMVLFRFGHLGDLREHFLLSRFRLQLPSALLHRGSFLGGESGDLSLAAGLCADFSMPFV